MPLADFTEFTFADGDISHRAFKKGAGPGVVVLHELPGMTPESKTRFEMLLGVKEHEMHHRAQLMLIERMLGITPHLTKQQQERMARMQQQQK